MTITGQMNDEGHFVFKLEREDGTAAYAAVSKEMVDGGPDWGPRSWLLEQVAKHLNEAAALLIEQPPAN